LSSDTRFRVFLRIDAVIGFDIAMNAQSVRILIADDNEVARGSLSELLSNHDGWEVCAAVENGEQAVLKASELKPNLVILDLAMPVKDGLRATREIGQILPSVPIVIYTMHDSSWLELEARKAGARYMVAKTDTDKLLTVVESVLAKEPQVPASMAAQVAVAAAVVTNPVRNQTTLTESPAIAKAAPDPEADTNDFKPN
jgi:DNA-binding NarL/FixJ family response regulator